MSITITNEAEAEQQYRASVKMVAGMFLAQIKHAEELGAIAAMQPEPAVCPFMEAGLGRLKDAWFKGYAK